MGDELESAVREALSEIQQSGIFCCHPDLSQQQLDGAVRIAMRHLARLHSPMPTAERQGASAGRKKRTNRSVRQAG